MLETLAEVFIEFAKVTFLFKQNGRSRTKESWSMTVNTYYIYIYVFMTDNIYAIFICMIYPCHIHTNQFDYHDMKIWSIDIGCLLIIYRS
jgi:hypothetical protein